MSCALNTISPTTAHYNATHYSVITLLFCDAWLQRMLRVVCGAKAYSGVWEGGRGKGGEERERREGRV